MTKIAYITRVTIPNKVAQAAQITSMCKAFDDYFGIDFLLVSTSKESDYLDDLPFNRKIIKIKTKNVILKNIFFAVKIFFFLRKSDIEHIYTRDVLISLLSSVFFKIPTCYEAHQPMRSFPSRVLQSIVAKNKFYNLVTITRSLKDYYEKKFSYKNEITVIPNGAYLDDYKTTKTKNDLRKELGFRIDDFVIVHTGSLFENRGFEKFKVILKNFPKIKLIQLGGNLQDIDKLKTKLHSFKNIQFIDYQPKNIVVKYQLAADLLLYLTSKKSPIYWCTSPNKIFEYMATNNPILAPNIGSIPEILNKSNSFIFNIDDDTDLINRITTIINKNNKVITDKAYNEAISNYNMTERVNKIKNLLLISENSSKN